jgi:gas vesicle protein
MERTAETVGPVRPSDGLNNIGPGGAGSFILGLLTGIAVTGALVLLYAPKSGPETRGLLKNEYYETQRMLQNWNRDVRERIDRLGQIIRFSAGQEIMTGSDGHQDENQ